MENQTDPVCGMQVDPGDAAGQTDYQGRTYYFCSASCKDRFESDPQQYAAGSGESTGR